MRFIATAVFSAFLSFAAPSFAATTVHSSQSGHLRDNPIKTITLGLQPEGLSGLIHTHTNDLIYALGYANKVHYFGEASSKWMAEELAAETTSLQTIPVPLGGTEGAILTPAGDVNAIISLDGQPYVFNPMLLGLVNGMQEGGSCAVLHEHSADNLTSSDIMTTPSLAPSLASNATGNIIDALAYYTPGLVTAYGGLAGMTARVDALIALSNQAYSTGKLTYQIRRVGLELLNVADTTSNDSLLGQRYARSGPFVGLNAKRDQLGADLVSVIRPLYANTQGSGGVAYVSGVNVSDVSTYANLALSVVSFSNPLDSIMLNIAVTGAANQTSCAAADITIKCPIPVSYSVTVTPVPAAVRMTFTPSTQTLAALTNDKIMNFVVKTSK